MFALAQPDSPHLPPEPGARRNDFIRRWLGWLILGALVFVCWTRWPMFGLGVNWSRYVQVREGMSKSDVIKILGTRFEAGRTQELGLQGQPRKSKFPVLTWWGFLGNGKIEVAFDHDDLCRWKEYDPYAHDSRGDSVRE
jgi:hypothetical protein